MELSQREPTDKETATLKAKLDKAKMFTHGVKLQDTMPASAKPGAAPMNVNASYSQSLMGTMHR